MNIKILANEYAERVCNGEFPITYTREQVVRHTENDFIAGVEAVLEELKRQNTSITNAEYSRLMKALYYPKFK